ncbi:hypothetical protein ABK040_003817 [Willaertia magna]
MQNTNNLAKFWWQADNEEEKKIDTSTTKFFDNNNPPTVDHNNDSEFDNISLQQQNNSITKTTIKNKSYNPYDVSDNDYHHNNYDYTSFDDEFDNFNPFNERNNKNNNSATKFGNNNEFDDNNSDPFKSFEEDYNNNYKNNNKYSKDYTIQFNNTTFSQPLYKNNTKELNYNPFEEKNQQQDAPFHFYENDEEQQDEAWLQKTITTPGHAEQRKSFKGFHWKNLLKTKSQEFKEKWKSYRKKERERERERKAKNGFSWWFLLFWILGLSVHLIMATNQVFSRYLQHEGPLNQRIPVLSLLIISNLIALLFYLPRVIYKFFKNNYFLKIKELTSQPSMTMTTIKKHYKFLLLIVLYQLSIVIGSSFREISVKYTTATYVQLIMLSNPFLIYFLGILVFKTEIFSILDFIICLLTVAGSIMVIIGSSASERTETFQWKWLPDFSKVGIGFHWPNDMIGIIIAFLSCIFFSLKMNSVNVLSPATHTASVNNKENKQVENVPLIDENQEELKKENSSETDTTSTEEDSVMDGCGDNSEKRFPVELVETESCNVLPLEEIDSDAKIKQRIVSPKKEESFKIKDLSEPLLQNDFKINEEEQYSVDQQLKDEEEQLLQQRLLQQQEEEQEKKRLEVSPEDLFIIQKFIMVLWPIIPSIILEDWSVYNFLGPDKWILLIIFGILNRLYAGIVEIYAAKEIGSGNYGVMFPLRIVIGLFLGSIMLHEWIDNLFSIAGCFIVVVSIVAFTVKKTK